jgi:hypothetical protein
VAGDPLAVDPTQMRYDAQGFSDISNTATNIVRRMTNALYPLGPFYGTNPDDPIASTFGPQWEDNVDGSKEFLFGFGSGMDLTGVNIVGSGNKYTSTDGDMADGIHLP